MSPCLIRFFASPSKPAYWTATARRGWPERRGWPLRRAGSTGEVHAFDEAPRTNGQRPHQLRDPHETRTEHPEPRRRRSCKTLGRLRRKGCVICSGLRDLQKTKNLNTLWRTTDRADRTAARFARDSMYRSSVPAHCSTVQPATKKAACATNLAVARPVERLASTRGAQEST